MKYKDFDLTQYNSYRIKSVARTAIIPDSLPELTEVLQEYPESIVIGGGNNIILTKPIYEIPFVICGHNLSGYETDGNKFIAQCGISMQELSVIIADNGFIDFETFYDIPGFIGGGICMNAGAGEQFISDHIVCVEAFDLNTRNVRCFSKQECSFGYRDSVFKRNNNLIILRATFSFDKTDDPNIIRDRMNAIKSKRWQKQPREYPNAGSVFKRPEGHFVGTMIQELGLKGYSVGGAEVSEKHAGFIVNKGNATGQDVIFLIKYIQTRVREAYGVSLELEQIVI